MKIAAKIILLLFCIMNFSSCNIGIPLRYEPSDNNDSYTIQYLFQHDGGDVTSIKTDSTKEKTITFHHEDSIIRPFR